MSGSAYGTLFRLTTFGESHGKAIGGVIDGYPSGISIDYSFIQSELNRRKPGQSKISTPRKEEDEVVFLSGIFEGKSTGTPIGFMIYNSDARSKDYSENKNIYRPSHADFVYDKKYGIRDYNGGGRSSARETASRVVAGALAKIFLKEIGIQVNGYVNQIGSIKCDLPFDAVDFNKVEESIVRCPDQHFSNEMIQLIEETREKGDTVGGSIRCVVQGVPVGLGEPVFDKLHAELGKAMLSINAVKGFEIGSGFSAVEQFGSQHNDSILPQGTTKTNHSGGVLGGISNGMPIEFRVGFKPVATIKIKQDTIDSEGNPATIEMKGRHDSCVVPRAVVIVESMAAIVLLDFWLRNKAYSRS